MHVRWCCLCRRPAPADAASHVTPYPSSSTDLQRDLLTRHQAVLDPRLPRA